MIKKFKNSIFYFLIITAVVATSCIGESDIVTRTSEMEKQELDLMLAQFISKGYDIDTTELGIYYIMHKEGVGPMAMPGDTLYLKYTGYLMDGTVFDAGEYHYSDSIWEFIYKDIDLISGFDDGISVMNKGAEIEMIIPSELAYGAYGSGIIAPYSTILFSAVLRDIKPVSE
jgi:FKBP-type peptidyl-prolyl cis-trans isomerase FkpA